MLLSFVTYLILSAALVVMGFLLVSPSSMDEFGESKYHGIGYLAAATITILFIVIIESIGAVLSLFKIKDDWAQEIYDLAEKNKRDK